MILSKTVYRVPFPTNFINFLDNLAFLRFEIFKLVPVHCVVPYGFHDIVFMVMVVAFTLILPPWLRVAQEYGFWRAVGYRVPHCTGHFCCRWSFDGLLRVFLVITYLLYPTLTAVLFQTFSCEQIHIGRFLHYDYAVNCDSAGHQAYEHLAVVVIVIFAIGVPVLFWALLFRHRHNLNHDDARYLGFFFDDYRPEHWYWEVVECFRKLLLTGFALFFGVQGSLFQTAIAMAFVVVYIPVLLRVQPYKLPSDNHVALIVNIALLFVLFTSLLLKVETAFVSIGRFQSGYSENTLGYFLICIASVVFVMWCFSLVHDIRVFNTRQSFRHEKNGALLVLPKLKQKQKQAIARTGKKEKAGGERDRQDDSRYHAFMSHSQQDGGDQVAHMKKELEKFVGTIRIFTDIAVGRVEHAHTAKSDLGSAIKQSEVFLVFLTKTYFTRKCKASPTVLKNATPC
eukprot:g8078.t1